eukprot:TRINITY_DN68159_c8_g3_i1.p1 TRINITY_DN68159_c8_g3~~TRINITY_DN68159_c8_g3_i1.p1  ORF type:complete len:323 (+),score=60.06 TRINITY_DN68159_c8_g3_i1:24-992(+)
METNVDNPPKDLVEAHKEICEGYDITCVYKNLKVPTAAEEAQQTATAGGSGGANGQQKPGEKNVPQEEEIDPEDIHAATKIQAGFRGHQTRKLNRQQKEEKGAATKIQSGFRAAEARKRVQSERENQKMSPFLDQFRPFELLNSFKCIVRFATGIKYFDKLETWTVWEEALAKEFPNKKVTEVLYSVHAAPNDFTNKLNEDLVISLHKYRELETLMSLILVEREKQAKEKAAQQAILEAQQRAREAAGEDEDGEEPEEEEQPKGKRLTRKQREALEAEEKARRQKEKAKKIDNAEVENEYNILQAKLQRFLEIDAICIEFAS